MAFKGRIFKHLIINKLPINKFPTKGWEVIQVCISETFSIRL